MKSKIYKKVLKEITEKRDGAVHFRNNRTEEICSQEKLLAEKVICFLASFLQFMFFVSFLAVN